MALVLIKKGYVFHLTPTSMPPLFTNASYTVIYTGVLSQWFRVYTIPFFCRAEFLYFVKKVLLPLAESPVGKSVKVDRQPMEPMRYS